MAPTTYLSPVEFAPREHPTDVAESALAVIPDGLWFAVRRASVMVREKT